MCRLNMSLAEHLQNEEDAEKRLPNCDCCGDPIYGGEYWEVEPWKMYCEDCKDKWLDEHRHQIE